MSTGAGVEEAIVKTLSLCTVVEGCSEGLRVVEEERVGRLRDHVRAKAGNLWEDSRQRNGECVSHRGEGRS